MKSIEMMGLTFGRLTVIARAENSPRGQARWLCRCQCGNEVTSYGSALRNGNTKSCGCLRVDSAIARSTKHGHGLSSGVSKTYNSWAGMVARCTNKSHRSYAQYGGAGITVDPAWLSFSAFLKDMGEKPDGCSIDRIDNSQGYSSTNCRWASSKIQSRNKTNNTWIELNGDTKTISEWAEYLHIPASTISWRFLRGWSPEKVLSPSNNIRIRCITMNGQTRTVAQWARELGISSQTIYQRLHRGDSDADALRLG